MRYAQFLEYDYAEVSLKAFGYRKQLEEPAARDSLLIRVACAGLSFRKRFESQAFVAQCSALVG
jgi:hypothetical protein